MNENREFGAEPPACEMSEMKAIEITAEDGARFCGAAPRAVVRAMARDCWHAPRTDQYMCEVANRCSAWDGAEIRAERPAEFLADLLRAGVIREARRGDERLAPEDLEALEAPEGGA